MSAPSRIHQYTLIVSFLPLCWLMMMAVHEMGHVAAVRTTSGTVTKFVLHPLALSRTDVSPNPQPLVVVWAGPLVGVALPLLIWVAWYLAQIPGTYLPRFLAGFCLIANGAYIGIGSFHGVGDARDTMRLGSPHRSLWLLGIQTAPVGRLLWHRLGPHFGLGESCRRFDAWAAPRSPSLPVLSLITMCR